MEKSGQQHDKESRQLSKGAAEREVCRFFEAIYDEQVVIEKWSNFQRWATIEPSHIYLSQEGAELLFFSRQVHATSGI